MWLSRWSTSTSTTSKSATATAATTTTTTAATTSRNATAAAATTATTVRLRAIVHQSFLQRQGVGQDAIADVVAAYAHGVEFDRLLLINDQLHHLQMNVHGVVGAANGAVYYGAVLQLEDDRFVEDLREEAAQSHATTQ